MSLAGPGANLCLVLVSAALLRAGVAAGVFDAPERVSFGHLAISHAGDVWSGAAVLLGILFSLNLLLAAFNMLPLPPLDGSGALPLVLSPTATRRYQDVMWSTPMIGWMGMMLAWQIFDDLFAPLFFAAVNLLYPGVTYS